MVFACQQCDQLKEELAKYKLLYADASKAVQRLRFVEYLRGPSHVSILDDGTIWEPERVAERWHEAEGNGDEPLSAEERYALADVMIKRWVAYKAAIGKDD